MQTAIFDTASLAAFIRETSDAMDREQRTKITTNLTFLKDRLGFLDPILDRLIEENVISMEQREKIESVYPPTAHKKFNEFIQTLLNSPAQHAFPAFIHALNEEGFTNIIDKLMKDGNRTNNRATVTTKDVRISLHQQTHGTGKTSSDHGRTPPHDEHRSSNNVTDGGVHHARTDTPSRSGSAHPDNMPMAALTRMLSDLRGKLTSDLLEGFEKQRQQERSDQELIYERKRQDERQELEMRMEQKIQPLRDEIDELKKNDEVILNLQKQIEQYRETNDTYSMLKEKYDKLYSDNETMDRKYRLLQESYEKMKKSEQQRFESLRAAKRENKNLHNENDRMHGRMEDMQGEIDQLRKEKRILKEKVNDQHEIDQLLAEKEDLQRELEKTKLEMNGLWQCIDQQKKQIEDQGRDIKRLMAQEQEKYTKDSKEYEDTLKKQTERLEELFEVVRDLKERQAKNKPALLNTKQIRPINKTKNMQ